MGGRLTIHRIAEPGRDDRERTMNPLSHIVRAAQRRLWINRWVVQFGWSMTTAAATWLLYLIVVRVLGLAWPIGWAAIIAAMAGITASIIWAAVRRESTLDAAVTLDQAAGLRERVSTGLTCRPTDDPFSQAVLADAE